MGNFTDRIFNFSAGPGTLPEDVLRKVQNDMWNIDGTGIGIMEHSHRGKTVDRVLAEAEADIREIGNIPDNYKVLFLTGGASTQFFMVPANLLGDDETADYFDTGVWAKKAIKEAGRYGNVNVAASSRDRNCCYIPPESARSYTDGASYVHYTSNNTIAGTTVFEEPEHPTNAPLVCDMSSDIFSRPMDFTKFALVYAGAQKNLGPAGTTIVIVRDDMLERSPRDLPDMLSYTKHVEGGSRYNTPPVMPIYVVGEVLKWIKRSGGVEAMAEHNRSKSQLIYDFLDSSSFWNATADEDSRSWMNICFRAPSEELEKQFIAEAAAAGLDGLKGHRSVGGMRASVYNAFPRAGCEKLVEFMKQFEQANAGAAVAST